MRHLTCHSSEFRVLSPSVSPVCLRATLLTSPSMPLALLASALLPQPLPRRHCFRFSSSTSPTFQPRYVMITALCTRELPSRMNRDHLRASTSARYARTVRSLESRRMKEEENVHAVAIKFMTLACSHRCSTKHTRKFKSVRPSFEFISPSFFIYDCSAASSWSRLYLNVWSRCALQDI